MALGIDWGGRFAAAADVAVGECLTREGEVGEAGSPGQLSSRGSFCLGSWAHLPEEEQVEAG